MRLFSISILSFILALLIPVATGCRADTPPPPPVRQADSLWTRKAGVDWPRMLGANYDSRSPEVGILTEWPAKGLRILWTADTGMGYGNGVVANGRWFQFDRFGDVERLSCLNAETGKLIWKWESPVQYRDSYGYNNGPRCSPVVDGDRVYVFGVAGTLACISAMDGKQLWKRDTNQEYNVPQNFFGVGSTPLIYEDKVWVMIGGRQPSTKGPGFASTKSNGTAMVALDKMTGKELHRVGNYFASYAAPVIQTINGKDVCLSLVREGLLVFDPHDGSQEFFFPWRAEMNESVNAASPIVWQNRILISEAYEIGSALLSLTDKGLDPIWIDGTGQKAKVLRSHWSTPLLDGNTIYASSGRNEPDTDLRCIELDESSAGSASWKPEVRWTKRNHDRMTGLLVDNHVLLLGENGTLQLISRNKEKLTVVAEMDLTETMDPKDGTRLVERNNWAPPVLSHGLLYIRGQGTGGRGQGRVICLELIPEKETAQKTAQETQSSPICPQAHAHNDYLHERPLLDALDSGFCSVEADIYLVDGKLLVAHTQSELSPDRTLQSLYLDPLRARIQKQSGKVHAGTEPFTLLIDIKSEGKSTYRALHALLSEYRDIFSYVDAGTQHQGAVTAIVSGNRATDLISAEPLRFVGIDGRLADLESESPDHLLPLISDNWTLHFKWRGAGEFPASERDKLKTIVERAHAKKRRVRFWATPDNASMWAALNDAGVDLINTDDLKGLSSFLRSRPTAP